MEESDELVPQVGGPAEIIALTLGGRSYAVLDILRATFFRGELEAHWGEVVHQRACHARAVEQSLDPDATELQARADRFRYDRDLITSEETEAWLGRRRLDSEVFAQHLLGSYWRDVLGDKCRVEPVALSLGDAQKVEGLVVELFLNGAFTGMVRQLVWRLASPRVTGDEVESRKADERTRFFTRADVSQAELDSWLETVGADQAWFGEMLELEAAFEQQTRLAVTPERLERTLRSRRLDLMGFALEEIEFDTMEAAREAMLCVREDHMSMEEVARESGYPYLQRDFLLEELPADWQVALISTPEQGLAGPFSDDDLIRLFRVTRKSEPTIGDEAVRLRLEEHLRAAHFEELTAALELKSLWLNR